MLTNFTLVRVEKGYPCELCLTWDIRAQRGSLDDCPKGQGCSDAWPIRPNVGTALPAGGADEARFDIGQPDVIGPAIGINGRRVAATMVGGIDQHVAHASGAHLGEGDLLHGVGHAP